MLVYGADFGLEVSSKCGWAVLTLNGTRYPDMMPRLQGMDTDRTWFQQDGATCYTTWETMELLHDYFPDFVISRYGDQNFEI